MAAYNSLQSKDGFGDTWFDWLDPWAKRLLTNQKFLSETYPLAYLYSSSFKLSSLMGEVSLYD